MAKTLVYQLYAPSWDNFQSLKEHLGRIKFLGADYVWLSGALKSLWYDHGYISNSRARIIACEATLGLSSPDIL